MELFVIIFTYSIIVFINRKIFDRTLNPFFLYITILFLASLMFFGSNFLNNKLSIETIFILFVSVSSFILGSILGLFKIPIAKQSESLEEEKINKSMIKIFFVLSIVGFTYYVLQINQQVGIINVLKDPNILNVKMSTNSIQLNTLMMYLLKLSIPNSIFLLLYILKNRKVHFLYYLMYIFSFIQNISVKRSALYLMLVLNIILALYFFSYKFKENQSKNKKKILFISSAVFILAVYFFDYMQNRLNKEFVLEGKKIFGIEISSSLATMISYFSGNLSTLDIYVNNHYAADTPFLGVSLRYFYNLLNGLNIYSYDDSFLSLPFVPIPFLYNTTMTQFYIYIESGYLGIFLFYLTIGFISTKLYVNYMRNGSSFNLIFLAIISTILIFSIREYSLIFVDYTILIFASLVFLLKNQISLRKETFK